MQAVADILKIYKSYRTFELNILFFHFRSPSLQTKNLIPL